MVTFVETLGILDYFSALFAALLVFAIVFALLGQTRILGENKVIQALVAIILALLVLIYPDLIQLINFISPWFVLVFIFIVMLLLVYRIFGVSEHAIAEYVQSDRTLSWILVAIGLIILLAGVFTVFGQRALQATVEGNATGEAQAGFQANVFNTIFHPKILGVLLVFAIAIFAIAFLGGKGMEGSGGGHH